VRKIVLCEGGENEVRYVALAQVVREERRAQIMLFAHLNTARACAHVNGGCPRLILSSLYNGSGSRKFRSIKINKNAVSDLSL
jgi:hypothetical protein